MRVETPPNSVLIFWPGGGGGSRLSHNITTDHLLEYCWAVFCSMGLWRGRDWTLESYFGILDDFPSIFMNFQKVIKFLDRVTGM